MARMDCWYSLGDLFLILSPDSPGDEDRVGRAEGVHDAHEKPHCTRSDSDARGGLLLRATRPSPYRHIPSGCGRSWSSITGQDSENMTRLGERVPSIRDGACFIGLLTAMEFLQVQQKATHR